MLRFACFLAVSLASAAAHADEVVSPGHADVGVQGALLQVGNSSIDWRSSAGVFAHAHVTPTLRLGLRSLWATRQSTSSDTADRGDGFYRSWHLDARAEWHLRPTRFFDPWISVGIGPYASWAYTPEGHPKGDAEERCFASSRCWAVEVTGDLGFDLHLGDHVNLGLSWSARAPFTSYRTPEDRTVFYVLFPSLRLSASF